jgi:hypothetical protein
VSRAVGDDSRARLRDRGRETFAVLFWRGGEGVCRSRVRHYAKVVNE